MIQDTIHAIRQVVATQPHFLVALAQVLGPYVTPALLVGIILWAWRLSLRIAVMDRDVQKLNGANVAVRLASIEATQSNIQASLSRIESAIIGKGLK